MSKTPLKNQRVVTRRAREAFAEAAESMRAALDNAQEEARLISPLVAAMGGLHTRSDMRAMQRRLAAFCALVEADLDGRIAVIDRETGTAMSRALRAAPDLTFAECLAWFGERQAPIEKRFAAAALNMCLGDDVSFDDNPMVSMADPEDGAYVCCWRWVSRADLERNGSN